MTAMPKPPAKRRGRPPAGNAGGRSALLQLRVSPVELRSLEDAARIEGKTLSEWARDALLLRAAAHG